MSIVFKLVVAVINVKVVESCKSCGLIISNVLKLFGSCKSIALKLLGAVLNIVFKLLVVVCFILKWLGL